MNFSKSAATPAYTGVRAKPGLYIPIYVAIVFISTKIAISYISRHLIKNISQHFTLFNNHLQLTDPMTTAGDTLRKKHL